MDTRRDTGTTPSHGYRDAIRPLNPRLSSYQPCFSSVELGAATPTSSSPRPAGPPRHSALLTCLQLQGHAGGNLTQPPQSQGLYLNPLGQQCNSLPSCRQEAHRQHFTQSLDLKKSVTPLNCHLDSSMGPGLLYLIQFPFSLWLLGWSSYM